MTRTRSCWIDSDNEPDVTKLGREVITRPVFDGIHDPQIDLPFLRHWATTSPFDSVGVYFCVNWVSAWTDPILFATAIDARLSKIAPNTGSGLPRVSANIEKAWVQSYPGGMASYVTDFVREFRRRRATRGLSLVFDGFQGGLWYGRPADVAAVTQANIEEIQAEAFGKVIGTNPTVYEPFDVQGTIEDLADYGFTNVVACHDAVALARGWHGCAFTQGRIPS